MSYRQIFWFDNLFCPAERRKAKNSTGGGNGVAFPQKNVRFFSTSIPGSDVRNEVARQEPLVSGRQSAAFPAAEDRGVLAFVRWFWRNAQDCSSAFGSCPKLARSCAQAISCRAASVPRRFGAGLIYTRPRSSRSASQQTRIVRSPFVWPSVWCRQASYRISNRGSSKCTSEPRSWRAKSPPRSPWPRSCDWLMRRES